jgi:hypothetical protein
LGTKRYIRYAAAFKRLVHCRDNGYYLECIAILDSLISGRLASRFCFRSGKHVSVRDTLGRLCGRHLYAKPIQDSPLETEEEFRSVVTEIRQRVKQRNEAIHAVAKVIRNDDEPFSFDELLDYHRGNVETGIELLKSLDSLDTVAGRRARKTPTTYPNSFFPENHLAE